ncbi:MAG TPA: rhodanese-like domain-containing protein [Caulobacter sp.]|nr:rhodanese-like domain-containing protein [Caulobacter sp.]
MTRFALIVAACLSATFVTPALAAPPTRAAMDAACRLGADPKAPGDDSYAGGLSARASGLTPQTLPGATTISAREAKCLVDQFGKDIMVIAAIDDEDRLPGAILGREAADTDPAIQPLLAEYMAKATGGNKAHPIVVYCHHESCFLSYNVSLRLVQAGYTQVFWMRDGLSAWKRGGYALAPRPPRPGEQTLSPAYQAEVARCREDYADFSATDWADLLHQIPTQQEQDKAFAREIADDANMLKICFSNIQREVSGAADKADIARLVAGSEAEVARVYAAARAEAEGNPAKYLALKWDSHKPAALRKTLASIQAARSVSETCGSFDFTQPPIGPEYNNHVRSLDARRKQYGACIENYRDNVRSPNTFDLESANTWIKATRRFTCAASGNRPNCIPDGPFNEVAAIASDQNVALAKRKAQQHSDAYSWINDEIRRLNSWVETLNMRIDAWNAAISR